MCFLASTAYPHCADPDIGELGRDHVQYNTEQWHAVLLPVLCGMGSDRQICASKPLPGGHS